MYFRTRVQIPAPPPISSITTGGLAPRSRRLHDSSTALCRCVQQTDRRLERRRAQVHIALRCAKILMTRELLNRAGGRPPHCQVGTECVPQNVNARLDVCPIGDSPHHDLNHFLRQRLALTPAQYSWTCADAALRSAPPLTASSVARTGCDRPSASRHSRAIPGHRATPSSVHV
jgi:hypothetical protein